MDVDEVTRLSAGRDRALDAARALAMVAVAVGHWLVAEPVVVDGSLTVRDVLSVLPGAAHLTWVFQVIPLFMVAGYAVGVPSWHRHRDAGGSAGGWVAQRTWRLLWPTLPVVALWTAVTQVGDHVLGLDDGLLAATRGIGLVLWFLAVYVLLVALLPLLDRLCERYGTGAVMLGFAVPALAVDLVAARLGYVSSIEPSWVWVNYVLWWAPVALAGRWWPHSHEARARRVAMLVAVVALAGLVLVTSAGWYPTPMVGVTGQARSNTLPPTLALALLAAAQTGLLFALADSLRRWLASPRRYLVVAAVGARAMTIYLWHLAAPVIATLALVLPGVWPAPEVGTTAWWGWRVAWLLLNAVLAAPVVLVMARFERPPRWAVPTASAARAAGAVVLCIVGWAAVAIVGLHVPTWPLALPWLQLVALTVAAGALVGGIGSRARAPVGA